MIYAPFGPLLNVAMARHATWSSRNIIPWLPMSSWEVGRSDRARTVALRYLGILNARAAPKTICVSQFARAALLRFSGVSPDRVAVIPHGAESADSSRACTAPDVDAAREAPFILNVGQPTPYRRTRELISGFKVFAERRKDAPRLVLVGSPRPVDAAYGRQCLELAAPLIQQGRILSLGRVHHEDVLTLTASADVIAYPSVHEDCPNVVLEALASSRVIVCADIPATRELASEAAIFVQDPRPESIAAALERAVFDRDLRSRLSAQAAQRGALFTWERTAAATVGVLEEAFGAA